MSLSEIYRAQVQLLIRCLPAVTQVPYFALKGGTAINLFYQNFIGMTDQPVQISELEATREKLFTWALDALTKNERKFLLSIKQGEPDWDQLPYSGIDQLPAIQWKLHNVRQMSVRAHNFALARLRELLEI